MKNYTVRPYQSGDYQIWNTFLATAKNATFLFHRDFMEYHSDRFDDFSLLVFDGKKLVALLPANKKETVIYSHQGLTYGGLVYEESAKPDEIITILQKVLEFLENIGVIEMHLKVLPFIYHKKPAQEIEYALFLADAKLVRKDTLSVISPLNGIRYSSSRKRGVDRGKSVFLEVREETDFSGFWNEILIPNLLKKHGVSPVHSLSEIQMLKEKFPDNIRHFNVYYNNKITAGTTIFVTDTVAHSQYMSADENKNELGSLDFLHDYLFSHVFEDKPYFDFGISNENNGKILNAGLAYWKSGFGSGIICQDFYEVATANHIKLENVFK